MCPPLALALGCLHTRSAQLTLPSFLPSRSLRSRRYATDSANLGKTLLQQVMEASRATLAGKLEAYRRHGEEHRLLARGFAVARGNSKAIASQ
jgi:hypothetical protein